MTLDPAIIEPIKMVLFDVDGVLTDGRIVLDNNGVESKFFPNLYRCVLVI